jgi:hypothetical protein
MSPGHWPVMALTPSASLRYERLAASVRGSVHERGGGAGRDRTGDLRLAKAALYQLSYSPEVKPGAALLEGGGPKWI